MVHVNSIYNCESKNRIESSKLFPQFNMNVQLYNRGCAPFKSPVSNIAVSGQHFLCATEIASMCKLFNGRTGTTCLVFFGTESYPSVLSTCHSIPQDCSISW